MIASLLVAGEVWVTAMADCVGLSCCNSVDLLTFEEKPCTTMRTGMVRLINGQKYLQVCSKKQWRPFYLQCNPLNSCYDNRVAGLVGHWRMDEQTGNEVADDSGYENHGSASGPAPKLSKFSRGRYFDSSGIISVPDSSSLNFGLSSFTVVGWLKILDVTYPLTTFAVKKGNGCYFRAGRLGWVSGWETGHVYRADGLDVCIRDKENRMARKGIVFDHGYQPGQLLGQWVHHAVVFDRKQQKRVFVFINGKKQSSTLDISAVKGSVDNNKVLEFGTLYGWKTKGTLDEYRVYNQALDEFEVAAIYKNHLL